MEFLFQLGRNQIKLFDIENNFEPLYIDGKAEQEYELYHAQDTIPQIINELAREFNLEAQPDERDHNKMVYKEIKLIYLGTSDASANEIVMDILEPYIERKIDIKKIIMPMLDELMQNKDNLVDKYGINYDGVNYKYVNQECVESGFSLLGYTITHELAAKTVQKILEK